MSCRQCVFRMPSGPGPALVLSFITWRLNVSAVKAGSALRHRVNSSGVISHLERSLSARLGKNSFYTLETDSFVAGENEAVDFQARVVARRSASLSWL